MLSTVGSEGVRQGRRHGGKKGGMEGRRVGRREEAREFGREGQESGGREGQRMECKGRKRVIPLTNRSTNRQEAVKNSRPTYRHQWQYQRAHIVYCGRTVCCRRVKVTSFTDYITA